MRIAVYGGSFNPPHLAHRYVVETAMKKLNADKFIVIPAAEPPHKALALGSPSAMERLKLTRLAFSDLEEVLVSDLEILRSGQSYTYLTIEQLKAFYPDAHFSLIIGTDMLTSFETWKNFDWLLANVELAVLARDESEIAEIKEHSKYLKKKYSAKIRYIETKPMPMSSSEIREDLQNGEAVDLLNDRVYARLVQKRSYGIVPNTKWLREKAYAMLKTKRIAHVAGCEIEAVKLAEFWQENVQDAKEAAILHDITKKIVREEQLKICEKYGIIVDIIERESDKLLHAKTGAYIAADVFGVSKRVQDAIFWHTTGKANMNLLEKIIYIADYIEQTRDFEGVETLRKLAYEDLDKALVLGLKMSVEGLSLAGYAVHDKTLEALSYYENEVIK